MRRGGLITAIVIGVFAALSAGGGTDDLYVFDGDTIRIGNDRIRLWGIDAPEMDTREGAAARAYLLSLIGNARGRDLVCEPVDRDRHGRIVARCSLMPMGTDIACQMVAAGHAVDWPRFSGEYYADC